MEIKDINVDDKTSIRNLIKQMMDSGGFGAKHLAKGAEILELMLNDKDCTNFLSFPACIIATGVRGLIAQYVKHFDAIITTCGTLDHDLVRAWGAKYQHGYFGADDTELKRKKIHRLGNIFIPFSSYGETLERGMLPILRELYSQKEEWAGHELCYEFGRRVKDKNSILYQAAKHNVPVLIPGITDGAFGTNVFTFSEGKKFKLNLLKDEKRVSDIIFDAKKTGALMVGGGISKHHTIWWNQFRGGLDYAVYVTTASQYDGSLSGARMEEAISWGKLKERAKFVTIDGDATIILPILFGGVKIM